MNEFDRINAKIDRTNARVADLEERVDGVTEDFAKLSHHREILVAALTEITDAHQEIVGRSQAVANAQRVLDEIAADGFYDEIPRWLEEQQINRWIDALGTAPPGADLPFEGKT